MTRNFCAGQTEPREWAQSRLLTRTKEIVKTTAAVAERRHRERRKENKKHTP